MSHRSLATPFAIAPRPSGEPRPSTATTSALHASKRPLQRWSQERASAIALFMLLLGVSFVATRAVGELLFR